MALLKLALPAVTFPGLGVTFVMLVVLVAFVVLLALVFAASDFLPQLSTVF